MKKIFTAALLCTISFGIPPVYSRPLYDSAAVHPIESLPGEIAIFSHRSTHDMQLVFKTPKKGQVKIFVTNESGEVILRQTTRAGRCGNPITLKGATGLQEGVYTVTLVYGAETFTTNFLLWK